MKLLTAFIVLASFCVTAISAASIGADSAWADVPSLAPSAKPPAASVTPGVTPEIQAASSASQLGTPIVPLQASGSDRSQQLSQQAAEINQSRSVSSGERRDLIQQVLDLPETVRVSPTRSGLGVTTQF